MSGIYTHVSSARRFQNYRLKDNVEVDLVIPRGVDDPDLLHELSRNYCAGCAACHVEQDLQLPIVAGHLYRSRDDAGLSQPAGNDSGAEWHLNDELVVRSLGYKTVELNEFILPAKNTPTLSSGSKTFRSTNS